MDKRWVIMIAGAIGILLFSMLGLFYRMVSELSAPKHSYVYEEFEHIDQWRTLDSIEDAYYMVFVYALDDEASASVKHDVFEFTVSYESIFTIYYARLPLSDTNPYGAHSEPALFIFENDVLIDVRSGEAGIYGLLDEAVSGRIP